MFTERNFKLQKRHRETDNRRTFIDCDEVLKSVISLHLSIFRLMTNVLNCIHFRHFEYKFCRLKKLYFSNLMLN